MKIMLVKRIYENNSMSYLTQVGRFIKNIKSSFIKPIPKTGIIYKDENFFIYKIVQDADTNTFLFFEDTQFAYYDIKEKLPKLKKELEAKGWKWVDGNYK